MGSGGDRRSAAPRQDGCWQDTDRVASFAPRGTRACSVQPPDVCACDGRSTGSARRNVACLAVRLRDPGCCGTVISSHSTESSWASNGYRAARTWYLPRPRWMSSLATVDHVRPRVRCGADASCRTDRSYAATPGGPATLPASWMQGDRYRSGERPARCVR